MTLTSLSQADLPSPLDPRAPLANGAPYTNGPAATPIPLLAGEQVEDVFERRGSPLRRTASAPSLPQPAQRQPPGPRPLSGAHVQALELALHLACRNLQDAAARQREGLADAEENMGPSPAAAQKVADLRAVLAVELAGYVQLIEAQIRAIERCLQLFRDEQALLRQLRLQDQEALVPMVAEHLTQIESLHALQLQNRDSEMADLSRLNETLSGYLRQLTEQVQALQLANADREAQQTAEIAHLRGELAALNAVRCQPSPPFLPCGGTVVPSPLCTPLGPLIVRRGPFRSPPFSLLMQGHLR